MSDAHYFLLPPLDSQLQIHFNVGLARCFKRFCRHFLSPFFFFFNRPVELQVYLPERCCVCAWWFGSLESDLWHLICDSAMFSWGLRRMHTVWSEWQRRLMMMMMSTFTAYDSNNLNAQCTEGWGWGDGNGEMPIVIQRAGEFPDVCGKPLKNWLPCLGRAFQSW